MVLSEIMKNKAYYEKAYKDGYGVMYPESHVIRWYERILKYELKMDGSKNEKLLDYGCGNGTHAVYFKSHDFDVFGADIDKTAIDIAKKRLSGCQNNFFTISPGEDITKIFNCKFDVIFSNQTLYFMDDAEMEKLLQMFDRLLAENGIVFFSMMSSLHYFNKFIIEKYDNGLSKVELKGRINGEVYVNITDGEESLIKKFSLFSPLYTGYYDFCLAKGDSRHHYVFTGRKR